MLPGTVAPGRALHCAKFHARVPAALSEAAVSQPASTSRSAATDGSMGSPRGNMTQRHVMRAARSSGTARGRGRSSYSKPAGGIKARPGVGSVPDNAAFPASGGAHSGHSGDWVGGLGEEVPGQRLSTILIPHFWQMLNQLDATQQAIHLGLLAAWIELSVADATYCLQPFRLVDDLRSKPNQS